MKNNFLLLILIFCNYQISVGKKIICNSTKIIELKENDVVYFESPDFPAAINTEIKENCKIIFNGTSTKENMEFLFVLMYGKFDNGRIVKGDSVHHINKTTYSKPHYDHINKTSITFDFSSNITNTWEVFQGFITYEQSTTKSCPLANREKPFILADESEALFIRSSYHNDSLLYEKKCKWEFEAPKDHSFKIKIFRMESEILVVTDVGREIIKRRGMYYFNTTTLTVSHTTTLNKNHTFSASINIVNLTKPHRQDDCKSIENTDENGVSIWTRIEDDFDTIIKCQKNITVYSGYQLYATVRLFDLEQGVDALKYYDNDTKLLHPIELLTNDTYVFLPYPVDVDRNITWEFTSDESISYKNFSVEFKSIQCNCTDEDFVIPCEGEKSYSIMGGENDLYCANLDCSYTIQINETCPEKMIIFKAYPDFANPECDYIHLVSDDEVLINTSDISTKFDQSTIQTALILPNRETIMDFKSFPGTRIDKVRYRYFLVFEKFAYQNYSGAVINVGIGILRIWTKAMDVPKIQYETITAAEPLYIFKSSALKENSALTVSLSDELLAQKDSLELVYETSNAQHLLKCLTLFDNENFSSIRKLNLFNYTIDLGTSITIYKHINCDKDISKLIIRAKYAHSINCVFQNNLINIENIMKTKNRIISMISGSRQSCDLTLVNNVGQYFIKQIWAKNEDNILLYNNAKKEQPLLAFNNGTFSKWKLMTFNALSYSLKIPANGSVFIEYFYALHKICLDQSLSSYYETPFYGTPSFKAISHNTTYYLPDGFTAKLTVTDIDISTDGKLLMLLENEIKDLKSATNGTVIFGTNNIIDIFYYEPNIGYKGAMINIEVNEK